jgi:hypothetical protein
MTIILTITFLIGFLAGKFSSYDKPIVIDLRKIWKK